MPFEMGFNLDLSVLNLLGDAIFVIPRPLIGEIKNLNSKYAPAALRLSRNYKIVSTKATGDDSVIELALKTKGYVLTNDKILKKRLRKLGLSLIYLRSSTHLVVEEGWRIQE
ncbi:MAG: twitching motility protein PilT [archaeon]|nr:twitching motility protein PilT [archaeon]